jgi:TRAP transporter TatT component family protein
VFSSPSRSGFSPSSARRFLTRSCISLFYISWLATSAGAQSADALYADRENVASARRAAEIWEKDSDSNPGTYEAAWKLARTCYWLGGHAPENEQRAWIEKGIVSAQKAIRLEPSKPEGHFWAAANMGALGENFGLRAGMKYRKPIRVELETVLRIDRSFMQGSADRALGRYYFKVPGLFGGSKSKAEEHLRASLEYNQDSTISRYFLAELYVDQRRTVEARTELQRVIDAPLSMEWAPEDRSYKQKASALLARLR